MSAGEKLINPLLAFHFELPLRAWSGEWSKQGIKLGEEFRIPSLSHALGEGPKFADVRLGWNPRGIVFWVNVTGKTSPPWGRATRPEESDGLHLWFSTRDCRAVRRANRYCQQFACLPTIDSAATVARPRILPVPIARALEPAPAARPETLPVHARLNADGYEMSGWIPAEALHGFAPREVPELGFTFAVIDRELGWQTLQLGPEYPLSDPSLWGLLRLVTEGRRG